MDEKPPPRIIVVTNQKGGVGKTTIVCNVAAAMAAAGRRVVVVDIDPQGNASMQFGISRDSRLGAYELLTGKADLIQAAQPTRVPGLSVVPSTRRQVLAELDRDILEASHETFLAGVASGAGLVDYVLVDCPPTIGVATVNAIVAADLLVIPVTLARFGLEGLRATRDVLRVLDPALEARTVVLVNMVRASQLGTGLPDIMKDFRDVALEVAIRWHPTLEAATTGDAPLFAIDPHAAPCGDIAAATADLLGRFGDNAAPAKVRAPTPAKPVGHSVLIDLAAGLLLLLGALGGTMALLGDAPIQRLIALVID
ncbi:MAG: AAA family ATPase [Alphaproteobacteria bacterium]|nr:AAA family ATPase [Alphaproteobacteria bacterium]